VWAALCLAPGNARASGFHIDEQDARATGRSGAVTANPGNASAIYYNPAGIAELRGLNVAGGVSIVAPSASFTSAVDGSQTSAKEQSFVLPQLFASWRMSELLAIGVGVYSPFGLALDWPASSPGRTSVRQAELKTLFITPALGLELSRWTPGLALGVGLDLVPSSVRLSRDILFGTDVAAVALSGEAFSVGGRVGLIYRPPALHGWSFGLTYRSPVRLNLEGQADFDAPPVYRPSLPPDGDVSTSVTLPQSVGLGIAFDPLPIWQIEVDGSWRGWSSYDQLDIELPDGSVDSSVKAWEDSLTLRVGSEVTWAERWSVRLGVIWDQTPVPASTLDFQLPDADRIDLSLGVGAKLSRVFQLDLGFLYVLPQERSTSNADPFEPPVKGSFEVDAWVLGATLGIALEVAGAEAGAYDSGSTAHACRARAAAHLPQCR
ncbi:MAG TPA: outer membrane protein transport protein, partial [Polyangiaceae bacterium]|nr:outer membrane protein transport protein [Polyangiaceae bacterium]